jgi:predicted dithiol-disulfide oxidoreductase (DUF899 family)
MNTTTPTSERMNQIHVRTGLERGLPELFWPYGEECHGLSVFFKNAGGDVFHTYSTYRRAAARRW